MIYLSSFLSIALAVCYDIKLWKKSKLLVFWKKAHISSICFLPWILTSQPNVPQNSNPRSLASFLSGGYAFIWVITKSLIKPVRLLQDKLFSNFKHFFILRTHALTKKIEKADNRQRVTWDMIKNRLQKILIISK